MEEKLDWTLCEIKRLFSDAIEGMIMGKRGRYRRRLQLMDDLKVRGSYVEAKKLAEDRIMWRVSIRRPAQRQCADD